MQLGLSTRDKANPRTPGRRGQIVSGSLDSTIRVWDIHTLTCRMVLQGHQGPVRCLQFDGSTVWARTHCMEPGLCQRNLAYAAATPMRA